MPRGRSNALPQPVDVDPAGAVNYDHRFHAGNFADVFKHVVLTRILLYLQRKPTPFRVIDTHAGRGTYGLAGQAAGRTQEWRSGIGRLDRAGFAADAAALIAPYFDLVEPAIDGVASYPGSPALAMRLLRPQDRMLFCELNPAVAAALRACVGRDRRAKVVEIDGYVGLNAFVPPVERRGLVLLDPPFEAADEFDRLADALVAAHAKWRDGIFIAWYPLKDRSDGARLAARIAGTGVPHVLRLELEIATPARDGRLAANGLLVVNPPYTLEQEMACLLPGLQRQLGAGQGRWHIDGSAGGRMDARRP